MKTRNSVTVVACALFAWAIVGCTTVEKTPDVITTPGTNTIVHENTPSAPNVVVTPPSTTHTETHTTTPPDTGGSSSTTTTTG